jgi:hypothetical protein
LDIYIHKSIFHAQYKKFSNFEYKPLNRVSKFYTRYSISQLHLATGFGPRRCPRLCRRNVKTATSQPQPKPSDLESTFDLSHANASSQPPPKPAQITSHGYFHCNVRLAHYLPKCYSTIPVASLYQFSSPLATLSFFSHTR